MFCNQCGKTIAAESRFCNYCGACQVASASDQVEEAVGPSPLGLEQATSEPAGTAKAVAWGLAVFLGLIFVVGLASQPSANESAESNVTDNMTLAEVTNSLDGGGAPQPEAEANWEYSSETDKVRGSQTFFARTTSTNQVQQSAPYDGGTSMTMTVRKHPEWGTDVILTISEGQMMCPSYDGCEGMVRFDDGPAQRLAFNGPADNSSETVFVVGAKSFIAKLKKAKKVTIEKTLYQAGAPQFEFDVSGFEWKH
jgi:hypothetical protein